MKLLFVHDHPFFLSEEGEVYSGGGLPSTTWHKYLTNFSSIQVYGRKSNNEKDKKVISTFNNVNFNLTENYSSIYQLLRNHKKLKNELNPLIEDSDVILVRLPSVLGMIAGEIALKKQKKLWVEQVGNAKEALGSYGSLIGSFSAPIFQHENKRLVKRANYVSYVTETKLQRDYPTNEHCVTAALSNVIIKSILNEEELNNERFFDSSMDIGLIGGFDARYKGQDVLLKAINELEYDIKSKIKLHFVGKGNYSWVLEASESLGLKDNIVYIGALEAGNEINNFLKNVSLYVQPSLTEGMPRATIEAMAMGCPVIGSNVGGIPDIVNTRFVHNKGDYQTLSSHINELFLNRNLLFSEAKNSLTKAIPYLKTNLDKKRADFYIKMNETLQE